MEININITLGATADLLAALRSLTGKETKETLLKPTTLTLIPSASPIEVPESTTKELIRKDEEEKEEPVQKPKTKKSKIRREPDSPAPGYRRMAGWMKVMGKNSNNVTQFADKLQETFKRAGVPIGYEPCLKKDFQWWIDGQLADYLIDNYRGKTILYSHLAEDFDDYREHRNSHF